ncbi:MAG: hypothetical protein HQL72_14065 [Magnetococcales bacterium]|nr:hypothetical protein [Magnetococcales bacterium]
MALLALIVLPEQATAKGSVTSSDDTAILDQIRYVNDDRCQKGQILIEEHFTVLGFDPADLLLVRKNKQEKVSRHLVSRVDPSGRIIHSYCANRYYNDFIETSFLSHNGQSTTLARYSIWAQGQKLLPSRTPTLAIYQTTRYTQFGDKERPEKGICCWHYGYINYPWDKTEPFKIIELPIKIQAAPKPDSHIYIMFYSAINGVKFYLGYQTNLKNKGQDHGPGVIFSRWDSQDGSDLRTVPEGFSEIGAYEGRFVSVRKPLQLPEGRTAVLELTTHPDKNRKGKVWLDLAVAYSDNGKQRRERIGGLRFPGPLAQLTKKLKITVESYALHQKNRANIWRVPPFDFLFDTPRIDRHPIPVPPHLTYPKKVPKIIKMTQEGEGVRLRRVGLTNQ